MSDASGNSPGPPPGPVQRAASLLKQNEHDILNFWIAAVREQVPAASHLGRVEIGDHLHDLLQDMVTTLASADRGARRLSQANTRFSLPSSMHGRERATLEGYTVGQVVHEYSVLRQVITDFFDRHGLDDPQVLDIMTSVVELATLNAVNEFSHAVQETRQKLISTLVHDVRTPLGVASNYLELLARKGVPEEQRKTAVDTARRNLARAVTMMEELLDTARPQAGRGLLMRFQNADINQEIHTICIEATSLYSHRFHFTLEDHPVPGVFDMAQIIRTMENLISNAVKFGDPSAPINISLKDEGDRVSLRVHNRGKPIPPEKFDSIFSFFTGSSDSGNGHKGWGLGLALIKTIAAGHGGEVIFESSATDGTTFGMTLLKYFRSPGEEKSVIL